MRLAGHMLVSPAYAILSVCLTRRTPCRFVFATDCSSEAFRLNPIEIFHFTHSYSKRKLSTNYGILVIIICSFLDLMTLFQILWHQDGRWFDRNEGSRKSSISRRLPEAIQKSHDKSVKMNGLWAEDRPLDLGSGDTWFQQQISWHIALFLHAALILRSCL